MRYSTAHVIEQQRSTRALLKFCEEHQYASRWLNELRTCLTALEQGDVRSAVESFQRIPLGGNNCFDDWFPPVAFEHEDGDYVWAVFNALVAYWSHLMRLSVGTQ